MKKVQVAALLAFTAILGQGCAVIKQDQVGVKRKFGKINRQVMMPGMRVINPFTSMVIRVPVRTVNLEVALDLPSKEGLTIRSEISILYHIQPDMAPEVLEKSGVMYERTVILPVFRSTVSDVTARFFAKDMHTAKRAEIEKEVGEQMSKILGDRGFVIEAVLLKRIQLPQSLSAAIEEKLAAEQDAQRMEFVLNRERSEADRRKIEAQGIRDAQMIIAEGLNPLIIQFRSIEAFKELSKSPNAKTIIVDGKTPFLISPNP